jgi:hypothetical protein
MYGHAQPYQQQQQISLLPPHNHPVAAAGGGGGGQHSNSTSQSSLALLQSVAQPSLSSPPNSRRSVESEPGIFSGGAGGAGGGGRGYQVQQPGVPRLPVLSEGDPGEDEPLIPPRTTSSRPPVQIVPANKQPNARVIGESRLTTFAEKSNLQPPVSF